MLPLVLGIFLFIENVSCSTGDRSVTFYNCLQKCLSVNCTDSSKIVDAPIYLKLLQWTCPDECKYTCMWPTVDWFVNAGIGVQQFYGKWPFIRIFGVQEPAAAFFSILNLACHIMMFSEFQSKVNPKAPFYHVSKMYFYVSFNAWIWSIVFHTRDIRFTEIMDYLSAFSMILFSVYHLFTRVRGVSPGDTVSFCMTFAAISYFVFHSYTVFFLEMNYGYNMAINIALGFVNIAGWLLWCWRNYRKRPYVKQCAQFMALAALTTLFELGDFPPIMWIFDAHALWHLSTSPLAVLWYR